MADAKNRPTKEPKKSSVYVSQVDEILRANPRQSSYRPAAPMELSLARCREPKSVTELAPEERAQLEVIWDPEPLEKVLASEENCVEIADVVDASGALRYRLYGWNYGAGYLLVPEGLEIAAFGGQHELEHWNLAQRELFFAMDHALRAPGHGFQQPLSFCWWNEECWEELVGTTPGMVGSEPYLRKTLAAKARARAGG